MARHRTVESLPQGATLIDACRSCGATELVEILSFGETPLANRLVDPKRSAAAEPRFPLDLLFCPSCSLVQIGCTVSPEILFLDYPYFSSVSDTVVREAKHLAERLIEQEALGSGDLVIEIASNDGYLLQEYKRHGIPVLGIEPARNVARAAEERGIPTECEFFGCDLARRLVDGGSRASVLHANNVLAHVPDLNGVMEGVALILAGTGIGVIEVPYVVDLIGRVEFDTIYHEHLCYFSLTALDALVRRHGLAVRHVERLPIHGGSVRIFLSREGDETHPPSAEAGRILEDEAAAGVTELAYYAKFGRCVAELRAELRRLLSELKAQGKRLAAYGASAKGSTLLNYFEIGGETLDFVVDLSPHKQGRLTPGSGLEILHPRELLARQPDYVLLLTWNFADEILEQQAEYRRRGGHFILPIPQVRVV